MVFCLMNPDFECITTYSLLATFMSFPSEMTLMQVSHTPGQNPQTVIHKFELNCSISSDVCSPVVTAVCRWGASLMDWPLCFLSTHVGKQLLFAFSLKKQQTRNTSVVALALLYFHQT